MAAPRESLRERPAYEDRPPGQSPDRTPGGSPARPFRRDIQGLRALAIVLVVLYEAGVPRVRGGYGGIDVFFVISGYLITGQLAGEAGQTGRIALGSFYLRRVRRLVPPAVLVIVATLAAAHVFAPSMLRSGLGLDGIFAAAYALNYRLTAEGVTSQGTGTEPSALQHFWSLAADGQLCLLWPLLVIAALVLSRRYWRDLLPVLVLVVAAVSLYISQFLLTSNASMSYFSVQSRAWEFAVGALVCLASGPLARLGPALRRLLLFAGLGMIVFTAVGYGAATPFPGVHALVPALGAALVIAAGCGAPTPAAALLGNGLLQWLGQLAYPWYLWYWPVLVLAPHIRPKATFSWPQNLALGGASLVLAAVTYYVFEAPLRRPRFRRAVWAPAGVVLTGIAVTAGLFYNVTVKAIPPTYPRVGIYEPGSPGSYASLAKFTETSGVHPQIVVYYSGWNEKFSSSFASAALSHQATTLVQLDPTNVSLASIASGAWDGYLKSYAKAVKKFHHPVLISFGHEMNGTWYSWARGHATPANFIAAWRHVVQVFRDEGASNAKWVWVVTSLDNSAQLLKSWWPGSSWVNYVGLDGYYYRASDTYQSVFGQLLTKINSFTKKQAIITEVGIGPSSGRATQIASLYTDAVADHLYGVVWFDQAQHDGYYHQDWRLEDVPAALATWVKTVNHCCKS